MDRNDISSNLSVDRPEGPDTYTIFLGLYLLILAFFIILVSISTQEEIKAKAVQDSLTSTFTNLITSSSMTTFTGQTGEIVAGQQFQERIEGLFASAVQIAKVKVVQPGRQMRIIMPADSLFVPETADIRPAQFQLLDRMVASLSNRPAGWLYEMELVIGSNYAIGQSLPIGETLEIRRVGAFAREMRARGAPPESLAVGVEPSNPAEITIWFYMRDEDENLELIESKPRPEQPGEGEEPVEPAVETAPNEALIPLAPTLPKSSGASIPIPPLNPVGE